MTSGWTSNWSTNVASPVAWFTSVIASIREETATNQTQMAETRLRLRQQQACQRFSVPAIELFS